MGVSVPLGDRNSHNPFPAERKQCFPANREVLTAIDDQSLLLCHEATIFSVYLARNCTPKLFSPTGALPSFKICFKASPTFRTPACSHLWPCWNTLSVLADGSAVLPTSKMGQFFFLPFTMKQRGKQNKINKKSNTWQMVCGRDLLLRSS